MRIAFAGTPEFAACALRALLAARHDVALVLTQPDRPAGRGMKLQASAVKQVAQQHAIALAQPRGLKLDGRWADDAGNARAALAAAAAECLVVAAYGLILPAWVLAQPARGGVNIHASLLPRWRGAAPIQRAIEAGDAETGITLMQMDEGLDTGAMLWRRRVPISPTDTAATLHDRLATLGAAAIVQLLADMPWQAQPQPVDGVTYAHKVEKNEARIDWRHPAAEIERRLRAFDPQPGANFSIADETIKLWRADVVADLRGAPGAVLAAGSGRLLVACGNGALALRELQRPGGRRMAVDAFLQAMPPLEGLRLGDAD